MLNQRPNSDEDPVLPIESTYTHMIYTREHITIYYYINISRPRTHKSFYSLFSYIKASSSFLKA